LSYKLSYNLSHSDTAAEKNRLNGDRQAALKEKGVLGLDWKAMAQLKGLEEACQRVPGEQSRQADRNVRS